MDFLDLWIMGIFNDDEIDLLQKMTLKYEKLIDAIQRSSAQEITKKKNCKKYREMIQELQALEAEFRMGDVSLERKREIRDEFMYEASEQEFAIRNKDIDFQWLFDLPERERREIIAILSDIDYLGRKLDDKLKQQ